MRFYPGPFFSKTRVHMRTQQVATLARRVKDPNATLEFSALPKREPQLVDPEAGGMVHEETMERTGSESEFLLALFQPKIRRLSKARNTLKG